MALPPEQVAQHIAAFEREGEAAVRARLEARQTLRPESYVGELAYKWLGEQELRRQNETVATAMRAADAAQASAEHARQSRWIAWVAIAISAAAFLYNVWKEW